MKILNVLEIFSIVSSLFLAIIEIIIDFLKIRYVSVFKYEQCLETNQRWKRSMLISHGNIVVSDNLAKVVSKACEITQFALILLWGVSKMKKKIRRNF